MDIEHPDSLVTGATGLVGRWLLCRLTADGHRVAAVARRAAERAPDLRRFVDAHGGDGARLVVWEGTLGAPRLGLPDDAPLAAVRDVYHLAANMRFGLPVDEARRCNVDGTLEALRLFEALPSRRRFVHVGGYRLQHPPARLDTERFPLPSEQRARLYRERGAYEASKHESQIAVRAFARATGAPITIVDPCSVIGDSRTGETTQNMGLGETVEALARGALPALAGTERTWVPVIPVDYLAAFLASVPGRPDTVGQALCVLDERTPPLFTLLRHVARHLGVRAPRWTAPTWLVRALPPGLTGVHREALEFLTEDRYDTASARAHAEAVGLEMPPLLPAVERWVDYLVGRAQPATRDGLERPTAG